jgi:hypothetical protein
MVSWGDKTSLSSVHSVPVTVKIIRRVSLWQNERHVQNFCGEISWKQNHL